MSREHLDRLREHHMTLLDNLDLDSVLLASLRSHDVITRFDYERIKATVGPTDRNILFLHTLRQKSNKCFYGFTKALCQTNQCHLSSMLHECNCKKVSKFDVNRPVDLTSNIDQMKSRSNLNFSDVSYMIMFTFCLYLPIFISKSSK